MSIALRTNPEKPSRTEGQPCAVISFDGCSLSDWRMTGAFSVCQWQKCVSSDFHLPSQDLRLCST